VFHSYTDRLRLDQSLLVKIEIATIGLVGGSGLLIWFAKLMATRMIKQYDDKQADHDRRLRDLEAAAAVYEYRMGVLNKDLNEAFKLARKKETNK